MIGRNTFPLHSCFVTHSGFSFRSRLPSAPASSDLAANSPTGGRGLALRPSRLCAALFQLNQQLQPQMSIFSYHILCSPGLYSKPNPECSLFSAQNTLPVGHCRGAPSRPTHRKASAPHCRWYPLDKRSLPMQPGSVLRSRNWLVAANKQVIRSWQRDCATANGVSGIGIVLSDSGTPPYVFNSLVGLFLKKITNNSDPLADFWEAAL